MKDPIAINALQSVDLNWTMHIRSVWQNMTDDVDGLHRDERQEIFANLKKLKDFPQVQSPLGIVIIGEGGSGKTHLVGITRQYALTNGLNFILVDMTDVRDFWETVLQGYISSLQEDANDGRTQFQLRDLIVHLVSLTGKSVSSEIMADLPVNSLRNAIRQTLNALAQINRALPVWLCCFKRKYPRQQTS
ncbi:hypothetical protein [Nodosilinea sp. P-1105]|uniref:hypothetical protein n=1 Tax=Nodosilinea sp. P-1105 TaxID=2546229 RepID=UPI00146D72EB|nr:hypothetical protein [Nodosilinea sp. P-1105]NMF84684.1 hypothetical protein [Nodosilinea sp. P-1105]